MSRFAVTLIFHRNAHRNQERRQDNYEQSEANVFRDFRYLIQWRVQRNPFRISRLILKRRIGADWLYFHVLTVSRADLSYFPFDLAITALLACAFYLRHSSAYYPSGGKNNYAFGHQRSIEPGSDLIADVGVSRVERRKQ